MRIEKRSSPRIEYRAIFLGRWCVGSLVSGIPDLKSCGSAFIDSIYVDPFFRNKGIGKRLLNEFEKQSRDLGYTEVLAELGPSYGSKQIAAADRIKFYESCGYTKDPFENRMKKAI